MSVERTEHGAPVLTVRFYREDIVGLIAERTARDPLDTEVVAAADAILTGSALQNALVEHGAEVIGDLIQPTVRDMILAQVAADL